MRDRPSLDFPYAPGDLHQTQRKAYFENVRGRTHCHFGRTHCHFDRREKSRPLVEIRALSTVPRFLPSVEMTVGRSPGWVARRDGKRVLQPIVSCRKQPLTGGPRLAMTLGEVRAKPLAQTKLLAAPRAGLGRNRPCQRRCRTDTVSGRLVGR